MRTPAVVSNSFILAAAASVYAWVESKMIAADFAPSHFDIAFVATGAIWDVIGWRVKPIPAVLSEDVSRIGTSPAARYRGSVSRPAPELYGPTTPSRPDLMAASAAFSATFGSAWSSIGTI